MANVKAFIKNQGILQQIFYHCMKLLLKHVTITDNASPYNGKILDVFIENGKVKTIGNNLSEEGATLIDIEGLHLSPGWVDVFAHFNDPGFEYKETIASGAEAAAAGGYTDVFILPNTAPAIATKTAVEYVIQKSQKSISNIYPLGAVTKNADGIDLAEMYDMHNSGAIAFTDGILPVQTPGLLLKALQYVKAFNGVIIQLPVDRSIAKLGLMNESITSTQIGLAGLPAIAEEVMIQRDIELVAYTESKLHITGISTAKGLALIKAAKQQGVQVSCSVTPHHLFYCDEDLCTYDTNLKVDPPLRSRGDMMALREGVGNGDIDCIASHHLPQDKDSKVCEFEYAKHGISGLETAYAVVQTVLRLTADQMVKLMSENARQIFGIPSITIAENSIACYTLFQPNASCMYGNSTVKSKSQNSPFLDANLIGKVVGIINKDRLYLNA